MDRTSSLSASAKGTMKSATAAADPLDDPPGVRVGSCGFAVGAELTPANSHVTVLPKINAPADLSKATQDASDLLL